LLRINCLLILVSLQRKLPFSDLGIWKCFLKTLKSLVKVSLSNFRKNKFSIFVTDHQWHNTDSHSKKEKTRIYISINMLAYWPFSMTSMMNNHVQYM
jgi:hypothetical protein